MAQLSHSVSDLLRLTRSWRIQNGVHELSARIVEDVVTFTCAQRGMLFLGQDGRLAIEADYAQAKSAPARVLNQALGLSRKVLVSGEPIFTSIDSAPGKTQKRIVYCMPLMGAQQTLGALVVELSDANLEEPQDDCLQIISRQAGAVLESALLYRSAITDPLTGLFTHRHFQQESEQLVRRASRVGGSVSLLMIDLDKFKHLNDTCGHAAGNKCLVDVSRLLRRTLRNTDIVARFGGDEFEVLLPDTAPGDAAVVAEKIRQSITKLKVPSKNGLAATIGVAGFPEHAHSATALFLRADEAVYKAKAAGRNCVVQCNAPVSAEREDPLLSKQPWRDPVISRNHQGKRLQIPEKIDGHSVVKRLGAGSWGEVLLVVQPELDRHVALKRPLSARPSVAERRMFEREAKVAASLNHPGVVPIFTLGHDVNGSTYYTMRPLPGNTLYHLLQSRNRPNGRPQMEFSLDRLLEILQRASETIAFAHNRNVVHSDLNPHNIAIGEFGEVLVIDWGKASWRTRRRSPLSDSSNISNPVLMGLPSYLAPELRHSASAYGPKADVFALGAILYEILTGVPPISNDITKSALSGELSNFIVPPHERQPRAGIDLELSQLCMTSLQRNPGKRPTAAEWAGRLGAYVRKEASWVTVNFESQSFKRNDWIAPVGRWKIKNGVISSAGAADGVILWKTPAPYQFRIVCEAWTDTARHELALVARYQADERWIRNPNYYFQFGAEANTCTKLNQLGTLLSSPRCRVVPGRRYRLAMEYRNGWLSCMIDNDLIFSHRELFYLAGGHIGFYACGPGANYRPLEITCETPGAQLPTAYVADQLFNSKLWDAALRHYEALASRNPARLDSQEAALKASICCWRMGDKRRALPHLRRLIRTPMEPYALAHKALDCIESGDPRAAKTGVSLFKRLFRRFKDSPARNTVCRAFYTLEHLKNSASFKSQLQVELGRLLRKLHYPPTWQEIDACCSVIEALCRTGKWKAALKEAFYLKELIPKEKLVVAEFESPCAAAFLANGRNDLLQDCCQNMLHALRRGTVPGSSHGERVFMHVAVCVPGAIRPLEQELRRIAKTNRDSFFVAHAVGLILLARNNIGAARAWFESKIFPSMIPSHAMHAAVSVLDAWDSRLMLTMKRRLRRNPKFTNVVGLLQLRTALERGNWRSAAEMYRNVQLNPEHRALFGAMLASLKLIDDEPRELRRLAEFHLQGPELDLAHVFLGIKESKEVRWPHQLWQPALRLWFALWCEARNKRDDAISIARPALDSRFGRTNCQPALHWLVRRITNHA